MAREVEREEKREGEIRKSNRGGEWNPHALLVGV
jgi:hypothetical protein